MLFISMIYLYFLKPHAAAGVTFISDIIVTDPSLVLAVSFTIFIITAIFIAVKFPNLDKLWF